MSELSHDFENYSRPARVFKALRIRRARVRHVAVLLMLPIGLAPALHIQFVRCRSVDFSKVTMKHLKSARQLSTGSIYEPAPFFNVFPSIKYKINEAWVRPLGDTKSASKLDEEKRGVLLRYGELSHAKLDLANVVPVPGGRLPAEELPDSTYSTPIHRARFGCEAE
jgi:hypothetical protein